MEAYWINRATGQEESYVIDVTPSKKGRADYATYQAALATVSQINRTLHGTSDLKYRSRRS